VSTPLSTEPPRPTEPPPPTHPTPTDLDSDLTAERTHLVASRAALHRMRERAEALYATGATVSGDPFGAESLGRTLARRIAELTDDPTAPLFFGRLDFRQPAIERFHIGRRHVVDDRGELMVREFEDIRYGAINDLAPGGLHEGMGAATVGLVSGGAVSDSSPIHLPIPQQSAKVTFSCPAPCQHPRLLDADKIGYTKSEFDTLSRPLPLFSRKRFGFGLVKLGMKVGGLFSSGIRLGFKTGFDSGSTAAVGSSFSFSFC
jgi:hypothetical protein